ncbi:hypothetical protein HK098_004194 [Nowakowskiella sp. JEL0407]|nr:hypothetical protein HK098_004194 [Nowakowskiella sp. JEL0407]
MSSQSKGVVRKTSIGRRRKQSDENVANLAHTQIPKDLGVNVSEAVARFNNSNTVLEASSPNSVVVHHFIHIPSQTQPGIQSPKKSAEIPAPPSSTLPIAKLRSAPRSRRPHEDSKSLKEQNDPVQHSIIQSDTPITLTSSEEKLSTIFETFKAVLRNYSDSAQSTTKNASISNTDIPTINIHPDPVTASKYRPYPGPLTITNTPFPTNSHPPSPKEPHEPEEHTAFNLRYALSLLSVPYFALLAVEISVNVIPVGFRILVVWLARSANATKIAVYTAIIYVRRILIDPVVRNRHTIAFVLIVVILRITRIWERLTQIPAIKKADLSEEANVQDLREKERFERRLNITDIDYSQHPIQQPLFLKTPLFDARSLSVIVESQRSYFANGNWLSRLPSQLAEMDPAVNRPARRSDGSQRAFSTLPSRNIPTPIPTISPNFTNKQYDTKVVDSSTSISPKFQSKQYDKTMVDSPTSISPETELDKENEDLSGSQKLSEDLQTSQILSEDSHINSASKEETLIYVQESIPEVTTIVIQDHQQIMETENFEAPTLLSDESTITLTYQVQEETNNLEIDSEVIELRNEEIKDEPEVTFTLLSENSQIVEEEEVKTEQAAPLQEEISDNEMINDAEADEKVDEYIQALQNAGVVIPKTPPMITETSSNEAEEEEPIEISVRASTIITKKLPNISPSSIMESSSPEGPSPARWIEKKPSLTRKKSVKLSQKKSRAFGNNEEPSIDSTESGVYSLQTSPEVPKKDTKWKSELVLSPEQIEQFEFEPERPSTPLSAPSNSQPMSRQTTPPPFSPSNSRPAVETRWNLSGRNLTQFPPPNLPPQESSQSHFGFGHVQYFTHSSSNDLIPPIITLSSLTSVTHLDLSGNLILRLSENVIAQMTRLVSLNVSNNGLEALPANIGLLRDLKELNAGSNSITSIPVELSNAINLEILDLRSNDIRYLHPSLFARMTKLRAINLSSNPIRYLPPSLGLLKDSLRILLLDQKELESSYSKAFGPYFEALNECVFRLERENGSANASMTTTINERSKSFTKSKSRSQSQSRGEKVGSLSFDMLRQDQNLAMNSYSETNLLDKKKNRLSIGSTEIFDVIADRGRELFGDLQDTKTWAAQQFGRDPNGESRNLSRSLSNKRSFVLESRLSFDSQSTRTLSTRTISALDTFNVAFTATQGPLQRILAFHRDMYDLDPRVQSSMMIKKPQRRNTEDDEFVPSVNLDDNGLTEEEKAKKMEKMKKKQTPERRNAITAEILSTEQTYVKNLQSLADMYVNPIQTGSSEVGIPSQDASLLFSNVHSILMFHQQHLLPKLEAGVSIGAVFREFAVYLKMYSLYYNNFDTANQYVSQIEILAGTVDSISSSISPTTPTASNDLATTTVQRNGKQVAKKFRNYMRKMKQDPRHITQINLQSFLILPVQRLPRYKLLLDELLSATPDNHPDYEDLRVAAEEVKKRVLECNEKKRASEEREKGLGVISKIKTRDVSAGIVEKLRVVPEGRKFVREFVARVVKVVEVSTGSLHSFGGSAQDFETTNSELKKLYQEGTRDRIAVSDSQITLGGIEPNADSSAALERRSSDNRYNEKNILFAANLKKDRYSTVFMGPLTETRFLGRKDEDERTRESRLLQEASKEAISSAKENRLILKENIDVLSSSNSIRSFKPGSNLSDNISICSSYLVGGDAVTVYGLSRTSGREFRFFLFSDLVCWCKLKPDTDNEYELVRVISLALRYNVSEQVKSKQSQAEQYRWPAEIMEVYSTEDSNISNSAVSFGLWTTNSKSSTSSGNNNGTREAVARVADDECVVYIRGEYSEVMSIVDAINACAAV